jgi:hypothetical protein
MRNASGRCPHSRASSARSPVLGFAVVEHAELELLELGQVRAAGDDHPAPVAGRQQRAGQVAGGVVDHDQHRAVGGQLVVQRGLRVEGDRDVLGAERAQEPGDGLLGGDRGTWRERAQVHVQLAVGEVRAQLVREVDRQ